MYLQRHGESANNLAKIFTCRALDPSLTENGRKQIEQLVPYYRTRSVKRIFTSPSQRAVESAEILGSRLGIGYEIDDSLLEVDVGSLEGRSEEDPDLLTQFFAVIKDWVVCNKNTRFHGGEGLDDVLKRLRKVEPLLSGESIMVGHSALFAIFLGTRGKKFNKVEDLFLPRGGFARYDSSANRWEIMI